MIQLHDILGQDRALQILQSALATDRIHHAWIFHGPPGVGKFTAAQAFAAVLLDPSAGPNLAGVIEADPDGQTVHLIASGNHADFHLVRKELATVSRKDTIRRAKQRNIPKEVVLEFLIEPAARSGHGAVNSGARATKVFVVDEAELLAREGQNALLKTLEEPPTGTVLILVTAHLDRLLPTVRSRCQRVAFNELNAEEFGTWLASLNEGAGAELNAEEQAWLLRFSGGSPGLATIALEHQFHNWYLEIAPQLRDIWHGKFPETLGKRMSKMVDEFAVGWVKARKNASKDAANKAGAQYMFMLIAAEMQAALAKMVKAESDPSRILHLIELLQEAEEQLNSNVNLEMLFENLIMQWSAGRQDSAIWFATAGI